MAEKTPRPDHDAKVCSALKALGYTVAKKIRLYGEEVEATSDPFPTEGGFAIRVKSGKPPQREREVQIPLSVIEVARRA